MAASVGFYYKHHLPAVGDKTGMSACQQPEGLMTQGAASSLPQEISPVVYGASQNDISASNENCQQGINSMEENILTEEKEAKVAINGQFLIGDKVRITDSRDSCIAMQAGHGGWHNSMDEVNQ